MEYFNKWFVRRHVTDFKSLPGNLLRSCFVWRRRRHHLCERMKRNGYLCMAWDVSIRRVLYHLAWTKLWDCTGTLSTVTDQTLFWEEQMKHLAMNLTWDVLGSALHLCLQIWRAQAIPSHNHYQLAETSAWGWRKHLKDQAFYFRKLAPMPPPPLMIEIRNKTKELPPKYVNLWLHILVFLWA